MSETNKALLRHVIEEGFNKRNVALFDELFADCVYRAPGVGELRGDAYRQFLTSVLAAFPDGRWTIEDQVAEADKVVTRWTFIGTHQREVMGRPHRQAGETKRHDDGPHCRRKDY